ncbi:MAG: tail fiber domain-containing protein [Bdellovibrionales bacterium]|nr:tail fiber domain-containing protein [Bdellovibrionales bacterium]
METKNCNQWRGSSGMSLPGVMVAVSMVGILAMGVASMFEGMTKSQNMVEFRSRGDNLIEEIRAHLSQTKACMQTLSHVTLSTGAETAVNDIKNVDGSPLYAINTPYGGNTFTIARMTFNYTPGDTPSSTPNTGQGVLTFQVVAQKKVAGVSTLAPKMIGIRVVKNPSTGAIIECISLSKMTDGIWQRTANINDIYYGNGLVGIGLSNPQALLHIHSERTQGALIVSGFGDDNLTHSALYLGGEDEENLLDDSWVIAHKKLVGAPMAGAFQIQRWDGGMSSEAPMTVLKNMNVGLAGVFEPTTKLDVGGDTRIRGGLTADGTITAPLVVGTSDARLKSHVRPIVESVLDAIGSIVPVRFRWSRPSENLGADQIGVLAQNIEDIFPELVREANNIKSVDFSGMTSILIKGVQELRTENQQLRERLDKLEKQMSMGPSKE